MLALHLLAENDFTMVRSALIRELDGDVTCAVVLTRIYWRTQADPTGWWTGAYVTLADELGISEKQARDATTKLIAAGHLEREQKHAGGAWDHTYSYKLVLSDLPSNSQVTNRSDRAALPPETGVDMSGSEASAQVTNSSHLPIETLKASPPTSSLINTEEDEGWKPSAALTAWALEKYPLIDYEKVRLVLVDWCAEQGKTPNSALYQKFLATEEQDRLSDLANWRQPAHMKNPWGSTAPWDPNAVWPEGFTPPAEPIPGYGLDIK